MKKTLYIFLALLFVSTVVCAQQSTHTIIDDINTKKFGQGNVRVMQDETIGNRLAQYHENSGLDDEIIRLSNDRTNGFKIQIFSGNNQNKSREEAESKQGMLRSEFPQHQAQVTYDPPIWRLRVGNFLTRADADRVLVEIKKAFPTFGKEMYVVSDIIRRPLNK